jgi:hypothetical protein
MDMNPYEAPQTVPEKPDSWRQHYIVLVLRFAVADIALALAIYLWIVLPFITFVPGSEKGAFKIPALLGCAGLLHPKWLQFLFGVISLVIWGGLMLFTN